MERKPLSKRVRFEIFKRDGFACVYCGKTPAQSLLQVDHLVAVANGGDDSPGNLLTSCLDCNQGKSDVPLDQHRYTRPTKESNELTEEHIEQLRSYLALQKKKDDLLEQLAEDLRERWEEVIGPMNQDMANRMKTLVQQWPHKKLLEAMDITASKLGCPGEEFHSYTSVCQTKYFHGVLRQWKEQNQNM